MAQMVAPCWTSATQLRPIRRFNNAVLLAARRVHRGAAVAHNGQRNLPNTQPSLRLTFADCSPGAGLQARVE